MPGAVPTQLKRRLQQSRLPPVSKLLQTPPSTHSETKMTKLPALGVAHPLRIGKTVRTKAANSPNMRNILALKFPHIPDGTDTRARGQLTRNDEKLTVELATSGGDSTQVFSGLRKLQRKESRMSEYVLVFHDGAFWLERIADHGKFLRHDGLSSDPMDVQQPPEDVISADPDSWMMSPDELSGSSITTVEDRVDERLPGKSGGNQSTGASLRAGFSGKSVQEMLSSGVVSRAKDNSVDASRARRSEEQKTRMVGTERIALKTIASAPTNNTVRASPNERYEESLDDVEILEEFEEEEVEDDESELDPEVEPDADDDGDERDRQSNEPSCDSESGSSSGSGSDSDSVASTDSSSDEE